MHKNLKKNEKKCKESVLFCIATVKMLRKLDHKKTVHLSSCNIIRLHIRSFYIAAVATCI